MLVAQAIVALRERRARTIRSAYHHSRRLHLLQLRWNCRDFRRPGPVRRDTLGSAHGAPVLLTALIRLLTDLFPADRQVGQPRSGILCLLRVRPYHTRHEHLRQ